MITISGPLETPEGRAAAALAASIRERWPVAANDGCVITLVPSAKLLTETTKDVDVVLLATFPTPIFVEYPGLPGVSLKSLCVTIEVKDNSNFEFRGNSVLVRYGNVWENVTDQADRQRHALKSYVRRTRNVEPFVFSLIWLRAARAADVPDVAVNVLSNDATWDDFVVALIRSNLGYIERRAELDARLTADTITALHSLFTSRLTPSKLNREKMEMICRGKLKDQKYAEKMGTQMLIFNGRGGTGKTVSLLQTAYDLYEARRKRVLILTYNHALRADIQRLLMLLGMLNGGIERTVEIRTADKFFVDLVGSLGVTRDWRSAPDFEEELTSAVSEVLERLRSGELIEAASNLLSLLPFCWDFVMIDEGQDWPAERRDLLVELFGYGRLVVADGVDQLVQRQEQTEWTERLPRGTFQHVPLRKSLRLKQDLCKFVLGVADVVGLKQWRVEPDPDVRGGRIVVIVGAFERAGDILKQVLIDSSADGNEPVDVLACVPHQLCTGAKSARSSKLTPFLKEWGYDVWEGVDEHTRKESLPERLEQVRVVQYDSSRGLEGWTAILLGLDLFFENKRDDVRSAPTQKALFQDSAAFARQRAAQWLMIPLTRAIDTLVLHVASPTSELCAILREADERSGRLAEWIAVR